MRVISGAYRGKNLSAPKGLSTRPTSDRVREALFNILSSRIDFAGISVLDICAGTGSLGIEAISRGAIACCFIEYSLSVKPILLKNLTVTGCTEKAEILTMDAVKALQNISLNSKCFDLIFFDPPYDSELYKPVLEALDTHKFLTHGSTLVVECSSRKPLLEFYGCMKRFDRRVYGETALDFFALEE
jgi:16S rRNA (guanine(966)-N(2))-methyltransferase RsmD